MGVIFFQTTTGQEKLKGSWRERGEGEKGRIRGRLKEREKEKREENRERKRKRERGSE